jgi:hypothetical protein
MTRIDEIERTATLGTNCGFLIGEFAFHDILALVAIARYAAAMFEAEDAYNTQGISFHETERAIAAYDAADESLRAALAPLLAEVGTGHGEGAGL